MRKLVAIIFGIVLIGAGIIIGKDFYFKSILTKELAKKYGDKISIGYAHIGLINKNIEIKNIKIENKITVKNISSNIDILELLKNNEININQVNIDGVDIKIEKIASDDNQNKNYTQSFINEMNKKVDLKDNILNMIGNIFGEEKIYDILSENLIDFLINHIDYIDVVAEKKINDSLKEEKEKLNKGYLEFIKFLENGFFNPIAGKNIFIKDVVVNGTVLKTPFSGKLQNITNDLNKVKEISINFLMKDKNTEISIAGEFDPKNIVGNIYVKAPVLYLYNWSEFDKYFKKGSVSCDQQIRLNKSSLDLSGRIQINDILLNKENLINEKGITELDKVVLNRVLNIAEKNIRQITVNDEYTTLMNEIKIKSTIPADIKNVLIKDKGNIKKEISGDVDRYYSNYVQEKKKNIGNFFKNIFK